MQPYKRPLWTDACLQTFNHHLFSPPPTYSHHCYFLTVQLFPLPPLPLGEYRIVAEDFLETFDRCDCRISCVTKASMESLSAKNFNPSCNTLYIGVITQQLAFVGWISGYEIPHAVSHIILLSNGTLEELRGSVTIHKPIFLMLTMWHISLLVI